MSLSSRNRRSSRYQYKNYQILKNPHIDHDDDGEDIYVISQRDYNDNDNSTNNNGNIKNSNNKHNKNGQNKLIQCGACFRSFHTQAQCM